MKKIITLIVLLTVVVTMLSAVKVKEKSVQEIFKDYGMNVSVQFYNNQLTVVDREILTEYSMYYQLGYLFEVLDEYYSQYNIKLGTSNINYLVFRFQLVQEGNWAEVHFTKQDLIIISDSNTIERARYIDSIL